MLCLLAWAMIIIPKAFIDPEVLAYHDKILTGPDLNWQPTAYQAASSTLSITCQEFL
jgi:hypothetical protein